jgi:hypothetical protein
VLIEGQEGTRVELDLGGYEFPEMQARGPHFDHDANWLRVRGKIFDGTQSWSFDDPCLMTDEAASLAHWLRGVVSGVVEPDVWMGKTSAWFTEPNVSARLDARTDETVAIVWYFSQESAPPGALDDIRYGEGHAVETTVLRLSLTAAIDDWEAQLRRFPVRRASESG